MNPLLKDLMEPSVGSRLIELDTNHEWYRSDDGIWHCRCDGDEVDWTWPAIVEDVGPTFTGYRVAR